MFVTRLLFIVAALELSPGRAGAENVSRTPPESYAKSIAPLLLPAEPLLAGKPAEAAQETGGEILLFERIVQVEDDGRKLSASHFIYRAVTEAGTEGLERDVNGFHKRRQRVSLALAHTIAPDGRRLPVKEDAAFVQTPQRAADAALYDDQAEAVVIYPDVKAGSATEHVLVEEDIAARIPGQFTSALLFQGSWPAAQVRHVVELPRALADRLTITVLGAVPEPVRTETAEGKRVRFTWEMKNIAPAPPEQGRPPATQSGPAVFLTTLRSWEEFMAWYWPQVEPQLVPDAALRAKVEEWTRDAKDRDAIIAALLRHASDDVRYTGLEFADGDLVPRPVSRTWENQYGDCKDKACLLAAMLQLKGLRAHPALINTDYPGRVERRSPDFRHFDHCILAVEKEGGGWIFCDPTIPGLLPGMIGPADGERDVLLVKPGVEWARTPPHDYGAMKFKLDAEMDAAGGLSGWCTIEAEGSNAAWQAWREAKDSREELLDRMRRMMTGFALGVRVVDVKKQSSRQPGQPWRIEIYFLIPGAGGQSVAFPADRGYIPNLGNHRERQSPWPFWRERVECTGRVKLPPGRVPETLPAAHRSDSRSAQCEAAWSFADGVAEGRFVLVTKESAVTPADWPGFMDQMAALRAWADRPLTLKDGDSAPAAPPADELSGLALMPSVEGQINLVEEKYPGGGNAKLRRAALEKAITLFPGDKDMLLRAGTRLGSMDLTEDRPADALRRIESFLESCRSAAPAEEAGLTDYMRALALKKLQRMDEAVVVWQRIAADEALSHYRRAWSLWQVARRQAETDKEAALATLEQGLTQHPDDAEILYTTWLHLRLSRGEKDLAAAKVQALVAERPDAAPRLLTYVLNYNGDFSVAENTALLELLRGLENREALGAEFANALRDAETRQAVIGLAARLSEKARAEATAQAAAYQDLKLPPEAKTAEDFKKAALAQNDKGTQPQRATRLALEALALNTADGSAAELAWDYFRYSEWWLRSAPGDKSRAVLDGAFALVALLPPGNLYATEATVLRAEIHQREDRLADARALLEPLVVAPETLAAHLHINALQRLAQIAETEARWDDALALHARLVPLSGEAAAVAAWHTACIQIGRGKFDEAFAAIAQLQAVPETARRAAPFREQMEKLIAFAADRATALAWWKSADQWWPHWIKPAQKAAAKMRVTEMRVAEIPDLEGFGTTLGTTMQAGDTAGGISLMHDVASAARVHPEYMVEFANLIAFSAELSHLKPLRPVGYSAARAVESLFPVKDAPLYRRWLLICTKFHLIAKTYGGCDDSARKFAAIAHEPDAVAALLALLWLAAVTDGNLSADDAVAFGTRLLESREAVEEYRPNIVFLIAHLKMKSGGNKDALALLEKEIPALPDGHTLLPRLRTLQQTLSKAPMKDESSADSPLQKTAVAWLTKNKPAWFDYVNPQSADDPALKEPARLLRKLQGAEYRKGLTLLARAGRLPESQNSSLLLVVSGLIGSETTDAAVHRNLNALMSDSTWLDAGKEEVLLKVAVQMAYRGPVRMLRPMLQLPPALTAKGAARTDFDNLRLIAKADGSSVASLKEAAAALKLESGESGSAAAARWLAIRLCDLNEAAAAEELLVKIKQTAPAEAVWFENIDTEMKPYLSRSAALRPVHEAMAAAVRAHIPGGAEAVSEAPPEARRAMTTDPDRLALLDAASAMKVLLYAVQTQDHRHDGLHFWTAFADHGLQQPLAFRRAAAAAALTLADQPDHAANMLNFCRVMLDMDDAEQRRLLDELLQPLRGRAGLPSAAADALKLHDLIVALRCGAPCEAAQTISALTGTPLHTRAVQTALRAAAAAGDFPQVQRLTDSLPAEKWHEATQLISALGAWKAAGMDKPCAAAAGAARIAVRQLITDGWSSRDFRDLMQGIELATLLDEPALIPAGLLPDVERWLKCDYHLTGLRVRLAVLQKDWPACAEHAGRMVREYPAWHEYKFTHGLACHHLGRKAESRASLEAWLKIVHDDPRAVTARALLKESAP